MMEDINAGIIIDISSKCTKVDISWVKNGSTPTVLNHPEPYKTGAKIESSVWYSAAS